MKNKVFSGLFIICGMTFLITGCLKDEIERLVAEAQKMDELAVPDGFVYENTQAINLVLTMPNTVEYTNYKSRMRVYSDSAQFMAKLIASASFDKSGRYRGALSLPACEDRIYINTPYLDTMILLCGESADPQNIVIDLSDLYNQVPLESIYPATSKKNSSVSAYKPEGSTQLAAFGLGNWDFSSNDFKLNNNIGDFFLPDGKMYFSNGYSGNRVLSWFTEKENSFVGTTYDQKSQYAVSQTLEVNSGDLLTFTADVMAQEDQGMNSSYWILPRDISGDILGKATSTYNNPNTKWTTKAVSMTMPKNTHYCTVAVLGEDKSSTGRILFDNFHANGLTDSDGDGVEDELDDYPDNPDLAYNLFYPNEHDYGTLAFEDAWPGKGDYDFNDMVIDYQFIQHMNADNELVSMEIDFCFRAVGASLQNGFGFQMEADPDQIESVTGANLEEGYISLNENGTEAGQTMATIVVTDNVFNVLTHPGGGSGINTSAGSPYVPPESVLLNIRFAEPVPGEDAGFAPFNPFIIINQTRGRELHLPGYKPTDLADGDYFGTQSDDTNPATEKYYMTDKNLPWGINLPVSFNYPMEKVEILDAYVHFGHWAQSQGYSYMDWYTDKTGYTREGKVYYGPAESH